MIYMSLVDLLATDFNNPKLQTNTKLQPMTYVALFLGPGMMFMLAIWAYISTFLGVVLRCPALVEVSSIALHFIEVIIQSLLRSLVNLTG